MENYFISRYLLAVDDEPFNLELIAVAFDSYENVKLTFIQNGKDALELLPSYSKP